jgi:hypothetical protein
MQALSEFRSVYVGDYGGDRDEVPLYVAERIYPAIELRVQLTAAVMHIAQARSVQDKASAEAHGRITAEFIDEFCGTGPHPHPWPWPYVLQQIGELTERYAAGSTLRNAAFDLGKGVLARAQELGKAAR